MRPFRKIETVLLPVNRCADTVRTVQFLERPFVVINGEGVFVFLFFFPHLLFGDSAGDRAMAVNTDQSWGISPCLSSAETFHRTRANLTLRRSRVGFSEV